MQALGMVRISENTKSSVSKTEGVLDGTWARAVLMNIFYRTDIYILQCIYYIVLQYMYILQDRVCIFFLNFTGCERRMHLLI